MELGTQTGIHTANNARHQQLIEEEREALEKVSADLSETPKPNKTYPKPNKTYPKPNKTYPKLNKTSKQQLA
ncbi:MAG: hypothetical protein ChlgKO_02840 [Chlamydiales bacterium]